MPLQSKIQNSKSIITKVLVTGSKGFVGRNLCSVLRTMKSIQLVEFDCDNTSAELAAMLGEADVIFHLAGVNRPKNNEEFKIGNAGLTEEICLTLERLNRTPKIVLASSIQAELDNPYGQSKLLAEQALHAFAEKSGARTVVYRFKNLFGKWCRPNYNSVTATFCHNIAHGLPVTISDPGRLIELTYIDDVVAALVGEIPSGEGEQESGFAFGAELTAYPITLKELAALITSFRDSRQTLLLPGFDSPLVKALYATYLSYLEGADFAYPLQIRTDERGSLAEMMKSRTFGQIFVSRTKPGITRGNHYHHTKTEKFMVVEGDAVIRFRQIDGAEVIEHRVSGRDFRVVDIPPGYTHHITNIGNGELVTLFWASEIFNPDKPDTIFLKV
ncbi:MAG: NAD-dependent epimerase/dehydratase family protein [Deltaproteobacteria bacterium]|nr:NAD-dependent epimerase/dehydratase family protein [Deltaproteobacteria bacterium]